MITDLDYWHRVRMNGTNSSPESFTHFYLDEVYIALRARGLKGHPRGESLERNPIIKGRGLDAAKILSLKPNTEKTFAPRLYSRETILALIDELTTEGKVSFREGDTIEGILREVQAI